MLAAFALLCSPAFANPVSLLQETREIECTFEKKHPAYDRLVVERKDSKIDAYKGKEKVAEFTRTKFLDSAILLSAPKGAALSQVLMNGTAQFTDGELLQLQEKDCEDTGASKTCHTTEIKKLFWSPEKLEFNGATKPGAKMVGGAIRQYGFFANHATYFLADGISLLDFGRDLTLLVGVARPLKCKYLD